MVNQSQMTLWLEARLSACQERCRALAAQGRGDEAVFQQIQGNVYQIFSSVLSAAGKLGQGDREAGAFLLEKLETIPQNWEEALRKAQAHGESQRAYIEGVKLAAAREIRAKARALWRDGQ